ncbi:MAG: TonB family protein [Myxococcales bacterium FL481]|nr:MAG: TonB family protein [Myxococcales bacterium FL481]
MPSRHEKMSAAAVVAILLLALAMHAVLAIVMEGVLALGWVDRPLPTTDEVMEVALMPEEEAPERAEPSEPPKPQRVVKNDRVNKRAPDDSDNISEFDNAVKQQQTAPLSRARPGTAGSRARGSQTSTPSPADSPSPTDGRSQGSESDPLDAITERRDNLRQDEAGELAPRASSAAPSATPLGRSGMRQSMRDTFGQRGNMERLEDVDEGAENILNSRRNRFASFFNRVRDAIAQHWHPEVVHAARDPYGKKYGNKTRTTRLHIVLAPDGSVRKIGIDSPAGIQYLDEEAIRAVRAAQPFTNPPAQLVDPKTRTIEFSFSFILLLDGSKRIFRYRR